MANTQQVRTPTGMEYGKAKELADLQRAAPLPQGTTPSAAGAGRGVRDTTYRAPVIPLDAPSQNPDEHVLDGVDVGPGRTAAQAGINMDDGTQGSAAAVIRGIFAATGNMQLASLLQAIEGTDDGSGLAHMRHVHGQWDLAPDPYDNPFRATTRSDNPPDEGGMFDPTARLDPSQVDDQRIPTGIQAGALAGLGAALGAGAGAPPPVDEGNTTTTADQPLLRMKGPR